MRRLPSILKAEKVGSRRHGVSASNRTPTHSVKSAAGNLSDAGPPDTPTSLKHLSLGVGDPVTAPDGSESRVLVRDTWSTDIVDELAPEKGDIVLYKHPTSTPNFDAWGSRA